MTSFLSSYMQSDDSASHQLKSIHLYQQCSLRARRILREISQDDSKKKKRCRTIPVHMVSVGTPPTKEDVRKQHEVRRRCIGRRYPKTRVKSFPPRPVEGYADVACQTELFIKELPPPEEAKEGEEVEVPQVQVEISESRIPIGEDAETQLFENQIFDFEMDIIPIQELLVGKTIDAAILELTIEKQTIILDQHKQYFEEDYNAELAEKQRLEERERRFNEEKDIRMKQHTRCMRIQKEAEKISALAYTHPYLVDLAPSVFQDMSKYVDPVETGVQLGFFPWLMGELKSNLDKILISRTLIDGMLLFMIGNNRDSYHPLLTQADFKPLFMRRESTKVICVKKPKKKLVT